MNRKDMIIVAVLVNACLLIVLFVSAVKSGKDEKMIARAEQVETKMAVKPVTPQIQSPTKGTDQIDQVLSQYSAKIKEKKEVPVPTPILTPTKEEKKRETSVISKENAHHHSVTVEKGDVLEKIARSHGVTIDEIMKLNRLPNTRLQIGQVLKLPEKNEKKVTIKKGALGVEYYVVQSGDNPWTIAQKHDLQVEDLLRLNNMDEEKAKRLRPGDRLRIK